MNLFDVYPRFEITPVRGKDCYLYDQHGTAYLDLYGGHAVVSIGHSHPAYVERISNQLEQLGFFSNSVQIPIQEELAGKLAKVSGYPSFKTFLCSSGAEAVENALKIASFQTDRSKIIVFEKAFHGRTSLALAATDSPGIAATVNNTPNIVKLPFNDIDALEAVMDDTIAGVLVEGIQGYGGIFEPEDEFLKAAETSCRKHGAMLILDEIQSGYGRTGKFFAHQHVEISPDIITIAKGMGNGFPIGGVLVNPNIDAWPGMLGTTFGGNHLACAAGLAVLDIISNENLIENA
ncbi:MAG: aminotransferase class III-fold pyridoxal phosphate-dependent enzyme, partial [Bacteroidota bacterium]